MTSPGFECECVVVRALRWGRLVGKKSAVSQEGPQSERGAKQEVVGESRHHINNFPPHTNAGVKQLRDLDITIVINTKATSMQILGVCAYWPAPLRRIGGAGIAACACVGNWGGSMSELINRIFHMLKPQHFSPKLTSSDISTTISTIPVTLSSRFTAQHHPKWRVRGRKVGSKCVRNGDTSFCKKNQCYQIDFCGC